MLPGWDAWLARDKMLTVEMGYLFPSGKQLSYCFPEGNKEDYH